MSTIDREAMRWMHRQSEGDLAGAEREAFDRWYQADIRHKGAFLRAQAIDNALARATVQKSLQPERSRLQLEWAGASWKQPSARRTFLRFGALAASIAVVAATSLFSMHTGAEVITTAKGEFRKVPLADKSVVSVNSDSVVNVAVEGKLRAVDLARGEAWFEVAKDKSRPFVVEAGDTRVRAVGTAFAVRRHEGGAEVLVTEGTVEVWSDAGAAAKRLLAAGERAFVPIRAESISVAHQPEEIERRLAWREGQLIFVNQTLSDAVADFNRYSRQKIVIVDPQLGARTLVGQYPIDAPERFARDVGTFLDVPVFITKEQIMIGAGARRI